ncbi:MAG: rhodanese-related sulfurtransferase [Hyphomicrobiales bacterium]|nr:rhodanese-related sulfurtransferase [Hyphomicrobiales bacterium]
MSEIVVASFYKFIAFEDTTSVKALVENAAIAAGVCGTILIAREGLNGSIAGARIGVTTVLATLQALPGCADLEHKESLAESQPFYRLKVRLKKEIVTMGVADVDPAAMVGTYVEPSDWNALTADNDMVVIDTRNDYEVRVGTFPGSIDPKIGSFREFPKWFEHFSKDGAPAKVAMFCTGGIRCEKATSLLKSLNIPQVYHLKGGILRYLEVVPEDESLWRGECFVFDQRAALAAGLQQGSHELCYACRNPVSAADKASEKYEAGISCPHCHGQYSDERLAAFRERQRQIELAKRRGERHLGAKPLSRATDNSTDADSDALRLPIRVNHG